MTTLKRLRNVGISAHIDSGKTTLTERMLFYCGRIHTIRDVRGGDGGATMDSDPIERARGITISSAATRMLWDDHTINVIDTPGHVDFTVEVERSLRVLDGAVLVLCSVGGVQSQSLTVDRQMRRYGVPRIAFINKMDRVGANPQRVIDQLRDRLDANAVALQIPIGSEESFAGVVDLLTMEAVYFSGDYGEIVTRETIPDDLVDQSQLARTKMIESLALLDDALMEIVYEGGTPDVAELRRVIRAATIERRLTPVLLGSAYKNKGVQEVLDAIGLYLPSPDERPVFAIDNSDHENDDIDRNVALSSDADQPLVSMAFKTVVEKFGQLTYMRIYQGCIRRGETYRNSRTNKRVRFGRLVRMHADQREEIDIGLPGDIIAVVGIDCASGDTFVGEGCDVKLENIVVADPVMRLSIQPVRREDADKLSKALERFRREDPTFQVYSDPDTGETLIAGMGQLHLDVYVEKLRNDHDCECIVGHPSVSYKECPTKPVEFQYKIKKMTGGPGTYALIVGRLEPLAEGSEANYEFEDEITGGRIDRRYVSAVKDGFLEALSTGPIGRYEVVGAKMVLVDGDQHENDSSEMAFKMCARDAMRKEILPKAEVVLLEPVMELEIEVPEEFQGAVVGHLARNRGKVNSSAHEKSVCLIVAEVPLAELFDYAGDLRSMTQGKGTFSMHPLTYKPAPMHVQEAVRSKRSE